MKAIVYSQYGPPDVLHMEDVEKPVPKDNELLVRVKATSVNRTDCAMLRAKPFIMRFGIGLFAPKKAVLGTEFTGEVEAVGKAVVSFKAGDKIFGFEDMGLSAYAEWLVIADNKAIATIPSNLNYKEVAGCIEGAHYALNMINKVKLKPGQKVLVNGATGAIGSAAVQLLKYFEADITAVCNTKNIELVRSLGAARVIDHTVLDFTKEDQRYDLIFDAVGKSSFGKCKPLLNTGGRYMSSEPGRMAQNIFFALIAPLMGSRKVIFPIPRDIKASIALLKKLMEEGKFKAVTDRVYPFEKIPEAFRYVETGQKTGNVVISLEDINS